MRAFSALYLRLDETTSSNAKLAAMVDYFRGAPAADAAWAVYFLAGGKPRQLVAAKVLREFAQQASGTPEWLFEECYQSVGDLAETIALLTPPAPAPSAQPDLGLGRWMEERLLPLRGLLPAEAIARLHEYWRDLDGRERFVCGKLITGNLRVGVSRLLVTRALASVSGLDAKRVAQRLVGYTDIGNFPQPASFLRLVAAEQGGDGDLSSSIHPYPFFLAQPLQLPVDRLDKEIGPPGQWQVEWKWDGIRAQVVRRAGEVAVWSRGEELVTERFPELAALARALPDGTVLDGEIVAWLEGRVQPFARLQQRLGRKNLSARILAEIPVCLLAYDLLEWQAGDWRGRPLTERRAQLERLAAGVAAAAPALHLSPLLQGRDWADLDRQRQESRNRGVEGMMLKAHTAGYGVGRTSSAGIWWKWKVDPFTVDAVLVYAQRGHGRRAGLYTDYTFAVWGPAEGGGRQLVPFAKAYSGLTDAEIAQVDAIIRRTTTEKFGPVRALQPTLVFELGFEGIARSTRHKSGIAVRFPRMLRWRQDKPVDEADTLDTLGALLSQQPAGRLVSTSG